MGQYPSIFSILTWSAVVALLTGAQTSLAGYCYGPEAVCDPLCPHVYDPCNSWCNGACDLGSFPDTDNDNVGYCPDTLECVSNVDGCRH